jgi:hypothetical protein
LILGTQYVLLLTWELCIHGRGFAIVSLIGIVLIQPVVEREYVVGTLQAALGDAVVEGARQSQRAVQRLAELLDGRLHVVAAALAALAPGRAHRHVQLASHPGGVSEVYVLSIRRMYVVVDHLISQYQIRFCLGLVS